MSLQNVQNLLARIFTDENLRRNFLREPEKIGFENDLSVAEIEQLKQIVPSQIDFFADSLVHKRFHEVEKFLPLTAKNLGADFENLFRRFAQEFLPKTIKKHLEDAVEFCRFLQKNADVSDLAKDSARFEQCRIEFFDGEKKFAWQRLGHDVRTGKKRQTFTIWLRFRGQARHFFW